MVAIFIGAQVPGHILLTLILVLLYITMVALLRILIKTGIWISCSQVLLIMVV
ncbi:hypothetical protein OMAG_000333 [Candidatus Omnitrophus magneticus]|uniref:Uncharacterized protein n=1 Tax=Candidatus Omnitrophus magneticus TaxID=1609969 RepID=A0A0F0CW66_9BACT|nr:hypothetical protein OMAG_000333 [Candidatus Omnitrophus magneticus]